MRIAGSIKRLPRMSERYYLKTDRPLTEDAVSRLRDMFDHWQDNPAAHMLVLGEGVSIKALPSNRPAASPMGEALRLAGAGL